MSTTIHATLPNPDCTVEANWHVWDQFMAENGIQPVTAPVMRSYQNLACSQARFMDSNDLIHYLTRAAHGPQSAYATLAEDHFGSDDPDPTYQPTVEALDALFEASSYRFSADSMVFKGVNSKPYYEIFSFDKVVQGQSVEMPGFLSTSVCRDKALEFAGSGGVLLVIRGLDIVDALVPENTCIATTKRPDVPEQEIVLERGICFVVEAVTEATADSRRVVHLRATGSRRQPWGRCEQVR